MSDRITVPAEAIDLGHAPVWDPPAMSGVRRWTCPCGSAVLANGSHVYGSAAQQQCTRCICGPDPATGEDIDVRPDCQQHGNPAGLRWAAEVAADRRADLADYLSERPF